MTFSELLSKRGEATRIGRGLGISHSAVQQWLHKGVPAERVLDVERLTGISRHELRPDVFGPAPADGQALQQFPANDAPHESAA